MLPWSIWAVNMSPFTIDFPYSGWPDLAFLLVLLFRFTQGPWHQSSIDSIGPDRGPEVEVLSIATSWVYTPVFHPPSQRAEVYYLRLSNVQRCLRLCCNVHVSLVWWFCKIRRCVGCLMLNWQSTVKELIGRLKQALLRNCSKKGSMLLLSFENVNSPKLLKYCHTVYDLKQLFSLFWQTVGHWIVIECSQSQLFICRIKQNRY